jgi:hypothetical protein
MKSKRRIGLGAILAMGALLLALPTIASARDRNHDNIPDRWERRHGLSLKLNQARKDQDRDALRNRGEFRARLDPHDADSDDDGIEDGDEGAGTIESFNADTGRLVINLFGGETIAGFVTDDTEVECDDGDDRGDEDGDGHGGGPGEDGEDHSGPDDGDGEDHSGPGDGEESDRFARGEGEGDEPGDEEDEDEDEGDDDCEEDACSVDDLVPGATVQEAEVRLAGGRAVFEEIELLARTVE